MNLDSIIAKLNKHFANSFKTNQPVTEEEIIKVESELGLYLPDELKLILKFSNGIEEVIKNSKTQELMSISYIIYSINMMLIQTIFYRNNYCLQNCIVFSDDGIGNSFMYNIVNNSVYIYYSIDGELEKYAESIEEYL
ncbi:SMI1/KNR4 family protein [Clostridium sp. P21]|uniref:SMI1/KNR4 family protein n=1 Tax=Clostridium muellerianum TaxID=2716538 RepID=A0A7Y0HPX1_9CLOT|nr:SMI1/KNR4 family protein [Clostridium muellerianum]NMM64142.1 SMI1/KNR4 family protein [Clostridium muellerianum]